MSTNYTFSITRIELHEKSMKLDLCRDDQQCQFGVEISVNTQDKESHHKIIITMMREDGEIIASISLACIFSIPDLDQYRNVQSGKLELPTDLVLLLNTVTIGTARGIMFSEFRGTVLHDVLLPVIDPSQLQPKPVN